MNISNRLKKLESGTINSSNCVCDGQTYEMRRTDLTGNLKTITPANETVCPKCGKATEKNKVIISLPAKMTVEEWNANANK